LPFKLVISDPEEGKAIQYELDDAKTNALVGKSVGDIVEGDVLGLPGYKLKITGGSDASGFPIRPDVHGSGKKRILIKGPPGFKSNRKGMAKRKTVRGRELNRREREYPTRRARDEGCITGFPVGQPQTS
jgi:small subunit ribosomal protein S6e